MLFERKIILLTLLIGGGAGIACAGEGRLEINQACALNGGCFPGDTTGFSVTINGSAGVSYVLTESLDLSSIPDTTAIDITGSHITLDLNGFEISGPITCTGSGSTLDCGTAGSGSGIALSSNAEGVLIRNGTIRNMSSHGVGAAGNRVTLKELRAYNNARDGFNGGFSSIATDCVAFENGDEGFQFGVASVIERATAEGNGGNGIEIEAQKGVVVNSATRRNGGRGFLMGHSSRFRDNTSDFNEEPDLCGSGVCDSKKRYYRTPDSVFPNAALTACVDGFHMASLWEIFEISNLRYDEVLGDTADDSSAGPPCNGPFAMGWVRTANSSDSGVALEAGAANCNLWNSASGSINGSVAGLHCAWYQDHVAGDLVGVDLFDKWRVDGIACNQVRSVWCVED